MRFLKKFVI